MGALLSLDIGGTKMAASVMTRDGTLLAKEREASLARDGPDRMIARLAQMSRRACRSSGQEVLSAGISVGGPLDPVAGIVLRPPNLPGWDRVPLRAMIAENLGLPERHVHMENDANAGALAELFFGAARGRSHAVFLTMSTGIGGGLILGGRLHRGATFNAGEVGHQVVQPGGPLCGCGNRGCLEAVASGSGIAARLREEYASLPETMRRAAGSPEGISAAHLLEAARAGEPYAVSFLARTVQMLATGIATLVFVLNPEIVILGTLAYHAGDMLVSPLRVEVERRCWPILTQGLSIVASSLGPRVEELAGLAVILEAERPDTGDSPASCPPSDPPP